MKLNFIHKKDQARLVGIWGLGISGKSIISYLKQYPCSLSVLEKNITAESSTFCAANGIKLYPDEPSSREAFLNDHDLIIASPGVDLRPYQAHAHKFLAETDLFYLAWGKPILAITGTLGKTSITHLLTTLLTNAGVSLATGGNIGTGMLDLIKSDAQCALLELSSFQLENCQHFVADGAVITNLYPNHLDRHGTMELYLEAKKQILIRQNLGQWTLVPLELAEKLRKDERLKNRPLAFFAQQVDENKLKNLLANDIVYYFDENARILRYNRLTSATQDERNSNISQTHNSIKTPPARPECFGTLKCIEGFERKQILSTIPPLSYPQNWLIIAAVLDLMGFDAQALIAQADNLSLPSYRLEEVATINGVTYYNDSKSTIMQATLAAVDALHNKKIILLLGGVSKGVDRAPFVQQLKDNVQAVICFGKEAEQLRAACCAASIEAHAVKTLEEAVALAQKNSQKAEAILLSPGGASFDLFKDYQERGARFKELVLSLSQLH